MKMSDETKEKLRKQGRYDLVETAEVIESGYAGILSTGEIVDCRKCPEAIPMQENEMLGIPKSKVI